VVCVEANTGLIKKLKQRFQDKNVTVVSAAVADVEGNTLDFYVSDENTLSTASIDWMTKSRFAKTSCWKTPIRVPVVTMDGLIALYGIPQFAKVDVEGFELSVFKGLSHPIPLLCFEWAEELFEATIQCVEHLQHIGYKLFAVTHGEYQRSQLNTLCYDTWEKLIFNTHDMKRYGMVWARM